MTEYTSQAGQDRFVLEHTNFKEFGTYVEIGAYHSKHISNTWILENNYFWRGIAFEIVNKRAVEYNLNRVNKCIKGDAIKADYLDIFKKMHFPKTIDYLQVDIEPAENSLAALKALPLDKYTFSVITFEHDLYVDPEKNSKIKAEAQEYLFSYGYKLAKDNVCSGDWPFEDWFIHD